MDGLLKGERLIVTRGIVHDGGTDADSNYAYTDARLASVPIGNNTLGDSSTIGVGLRVDFLVPLQSSTE